MIRAAKLSDIPRLAELLRQIHAVHAQIRPDIFRSGQRKYSDEDLTRLLADPQKPVFVYEDEAGMVQAYAMCAFQTTENEPSLHNRKILYLDDLCVDENQRGQKIGEQLYHHLVAFAQAEQCDALTLYVWNDNQGAMRFYDRLGLRPLKTLLEHPLNTSSV